MDALGCMEPRPQGMLQARELLTGPGLSSKSRHSTSPYTLQDGSHHIPSWGPCSDGKPQMQGGLWGCSLLRKHWDVPSLGPWCLDRAQPRQFRERYHAASVVLSLPTAPHTLPTASPRRQVCRAAAPEGSAGTC